MGESDSEEDSDYQPVSDNDSDENCDAKQKKSIGLGMSGSRKRKIDSFWVEMQQEESSYMTAVQKKTNMTQNLEGSDKKLPAKKKKSLDILSSIFGPQEARKLCAAELEPKSVTNKATESGSPDAEPSVRKKALELIKKVKRKVKVVEKRKFAGEEISIEKVQLLSSDDAKAKELTDAAASNNRLDQVLDILKGPKTVSTITKSSVDWSNFKEATGLETDLANASKEGFLTRQEFLERCDVRAFEKERDSRIASRK